MVDAPKAESNIKDGKDHPDSAASATLTDPNLSENEILKRAQAGLDGSLAGINTNGSGNKESTQEEKRKKDQEAANRLLIIEEISQQLEELYTELADINKKIAENTIELAIKEDELDELLIIQSKQEGLVTELAKAKAEEEVVEQQREEKQQALEKAIEKREDTAKKVETGEATQDDLIEATDEVNQCQIECEAARIKQEAIQNRIREIQTELLEINEAHPDLAAKIKEVKEEIESIRQSGQDLQAQKEAIENKISAVKQQQMELYKDNPEMLQKIEYIDKLYAEKTSLQNSTQNYVLDTIGNRLNCGNFGSITSLISATQGLIYDTAFNESLSAIYQQAELQQRINALKDNMAEYSHLTREEQLKTLIPDFEEINVRHLLSPENTIKAAIYNKGIVMAAKLEGISISTSEGYHPGHETVTFGGKDVSTGINPDTGEPGLYTKTNGAMDWIDMSDINTAITIAEQAYGTPPMPFYNETSKDGDTLLEKRANKHTFDQGAINFDSIEQQIQEAITNNLNGLKPAENSLFSLGIFNFETPEPAEAESSECGCSHDHEKTASVAVTLPGAKV